MTSGHQRGFSLLEVLVAIAIMALALVMLYRSTGSSARSVGDAAQYQQAMVLANSLFALRDSVPEQGWNESGESGIFRWSVSSSPFRTPVADGNPLAARLHEVVFRVSWNEERPREAEFATLLPESAAPVVAGGRR